MLSVERKNRLSQWILWKKLQQKHITFSENKYQVYFVRKPVAFVKLFFLPPVENALA